MKTPEKNATQQTGEKRESTLRNIARIAEENAELVVAVTEAFINGLQIGSVRTADQQ